jgi:DNA-binding MurR/RpiR family transcriptional regulator
MELATNEADFKTLIWRSYNACPPQQRQVAEFALEHLRELPFLTIPQMARRCGASEATIVRFAKSLGYKGYSPFKRQLTAVLHRPGVQQSELGEPRQESTLQAIAVLERENIQETLAQLDPEHLRQLARDLARADDIFTFGLGISFPLAELLTYHLCQVGLRASTLPTSFSLPEELLVSARPGDLLVVFSLPPYSRATLELLKAARGQKVRTYAIVDRVVAPAALESDGHIQVETRNVLFTNALASSMVLINALATEIALHRNHRSARVIDWLNSLAESAPALIGKA